MQTLSLPGPVYALWGRQAWMEVMGMDQNSSPTTQMARPMKRRCRMESSGSCTFSQMMASAWWDRWDLRSPMTAFGKQRQHLGNCGWFVRLVAGWGCHELVDGWNWNTQFSSSVGWDCWVTMATWVKSQIHDILLSLETKIYIFMVNEKHPKRRFLNREALDLGRKSHGFPVPVWSISPIPCW